MSNVLFVDSGIRNEKLGIMYVSAALKKEGHSTRLLETDREDLISTVEKFKPDFFAYSVCTGELGRALKTNRELKGMYPDVPSIFGGPHTAFSPEMEYERGIDYIVVGEGEEAIIDIINGSKEKVVRKPLCDDINSLPLPDRSIFYDKDRFRDNPMKNIITQRDCSYSCSYCYNHAWRAVFKDEKSKMFQRKSVDYVVKEAKDIRDRYGLEQALILDDNFIGIGKKNREWVDEFCGKWKEELGLPFFISARANLIDEPLVKKLKEAGLGMVNFALESATPYVQRDILNRGQIKNEDVERALDLFKKYSVRCRMQNMIGLPIEDPLGDALTTLEFNMRAEPDDSWVSIYQPYPGTKLGDSCLDKGLVKGELLKSCSDSFYDGSNLDIPDKNKIQRLQKWWHFIVKHKVPMSFIKDVLLEVPIDEDARNLLQTMKFADARERLFGIKDVAK